MFTLDDIRHHLSLLDKARPAACCYEPGYMELTFYLNEDGAASSWAGARVLCLLVAPTGETTAITSSCAADTTWAATAAAYARALDLCVKVGLQTPK